MTIIRVLQVEDSALDAELVLGELDADGIDYETRLVEDERSFLDALEQFRPDIVLSDLSVPGFSGQRALELLRANDADTPFVFVSATLGEEAAIEALRNGATDYILKQNPARLASAVRRALDAASARRAARRAEAELIRAQRFEALAMLAGGLSHDLRNLLQPLLLAGDSLKDYQDDPRLARLGTLVRDCGKRGLEMVQSMLSFARGARRAEQIRIGELLDALGLLLQGSMPGAVAMDVALEDPELTFEGNQTELQQCLLNLCLNAIQAMPDGGVLRLESSRISLPSSFFASGEQVLPGDHLQLTVADTGTGMDEATRQRLFEPFFTTKKTGTGLGLLSCKRIIAGHGGAMRVESAPGQGTRFHLYLPLTGMDNGSVPYSEGDDLQGRAERVLVVAEDANQRSLLGAMLEAYGYLSSSSLGGTEALQWVEAHGVPDLVLVDAETTLISGVRMLAVLVEHGYSGPVLLLARLDAPPDLRALPELEQMYVVNKPVTTRHLLQTLRRALDSAQEKRD